MGLLSPLRTLPMLLSDACPAECPQWVYHYFRECVCSRREGLSLILGLSSVFFWATAEIPQIVTNFLTGNTEGISLTFLLTWTIGDVFNLAGCLLEPVTLPTQLYMAVMYTSTTVVLVAQSVYYEYVLPRTRKVQQFPLDASDVTEPLVSKAEQDLLGGMAPLPPSLPPAQALPGAPVPVPVPVPTEHIQVPALSRKDSGQYIHSARSLVSSQTPTMGSFMPGSHQHIGSLLSQSPGIGFSHASLHNGSVPRHFSTLPQNTPTGQRRSMDRRSAGVPGSASGEPGSFLSGHSPLSAGDLSGSVPRNDTPNTTRARAVLLGGLLFTFLGSVSHSPTMHSLLSALLPTAALPQRHSFLMPGQGRGVWPGAQGARRLLLLTPPEEGQSFRSQASQQSFLLFLREGATGRSVGEILGWLMAAIYMGGRLPQIFLNIQRGTVEGLSPIMFLFALLGNATYVGSILAKSFDWKDIGPNMPWLVDAGVCVLLDIFILGQFVYYTLRRPEESTEESEESEYQYK